MGGCHADEKMPECYTKLPAIINLNPQDTTNASNEESALDSKPKSKPLLIIIVLLILAFGIAIMIDDDHELDRGLVKVIFKVLFYGVEALLSISK